MLIAYVLVCISLGILVYSSLKKSRPRRFVESFDGPKMLPLIGNMWYFAKPEERLEKFLKTNRDYGSRVGFAGGTTNILFVFHPDDLRTILCSKLSSAKGWLYKLSLSDWLGSSLFITDGGEYFQKRKTASPAFNMRPIEAFSSQFNRHCNTLVDVLKTHEVNGRPLDIYWQLVLCTLGIIFEYVVGDVRSSLAKLESEYAPAIHTQSKCVFERMISPWLWPDALWRLSTYGRKEKVTSRILQGFMEKIVRERKVEMVAQGSAIKLPGSRKSKEAGNVRFLDLLLDEQQKQKGITDEYIRDEINNFVFAGHDTTTSHLTWAIFLLASNPKEQEKLHFELDSIFGEDKHRDVEPSDLTKLRYLECCIKETLRLFPSVPIIARRMTEDFTLDEKVTIPRGTEVFISPWATHRLPEFFPEPEEFRPSRFLSENSVGRHPYSYIPFSSGPRSCMGQRFLLTEAKIILAHIFRNFVVELESPRAEVVPIAHIVVYPKNGLKIKLKLR